jgi:YidC/Oxa1 family membrane protein insertase
LSIAVLFAWGALVPKFFPELAKKPAPAAGAKTTTAPAPSVPAASPVSTTPSPSTAAQPAVAGAAPVASIAENRVIETVVDEPEYTARFSNRGAQLTSFVLKKYKEKDGSPVDLVRRRPASSGDFPFALQSGDGAWNVRVNTGLYKLTERRTPAGRVLTYELATPSTGRVRKTFAFTAAHVFDFDIATDRPQNSFRVTIGPGIRTVDPAAKDSQFLLTGNGVIQKEGSFDVINREKADSLASFASPDYVGIEDNYFLTALRPTKSSDAVLKTTEITSASGDAKPAKRRELIAGLNSTGGAVAGSAFFGPKEAELLERHGYEKALQFGMFGIIARGLLIALVWIYQFTLNYGWAIVVLTVIIKVVLYPLQHKSIVSMKKMQKLQPKMNAIKEKYKKAKTDPDQRNKMNMEMMKLYQTEKISPMSGCLPILLQLPILWAFYNLLSRAIELRGADFMLWITDLSAKDPYYITPILMTVTMFIQQWITPSTMDPVQKKVFLAMPIVLGWVFKEFPSGLVLYWLVQNILSIIQQVIMNKYWKDHPESLDKV